MVLTNKRSLYNIITSTNLPKAKNIESKKKNFRFEGAHHTIIYKRNY